MKDVVIIPGDGSVQVSVLGDSEAEMLRQNNSFSFSGRNWTAGDSCCEWLEIRGEETNELVGFCLTDFYEDFDSENQPVLSGKNVDWQGDECLVWFKEVSDWCIAPGPYIPAVMLEAEDGTHGYWLVDALHDLEHYNLSKNRT